jgi:putative nucleotidyltransferase with HDIG domain
MIPLRGRGLDLAPVPVCEPEHADAPVLDARILVVEDEPIIREIVVRRLAHEGYRCDACDTGLVALDLLARGKYDLLLADMKPPELAGLALLREAQAISPDTAVILVASINDIGVAVDALKDGAYDYIVKPYSLEQVLLGVSRALEKRHLVLENRAYQRILEDQVASRTRELRAALDLLQHTYHSTLVALGTALDSRDADLEGHSLRVTLYTVRLARQVGVGPERLGVIEQGALLHDIGKIGVPDRILRKAEKLTPAEWVLMRRHPEIGYRILSGIKFLREAALLVLHHQERFDGSGYPAGLRGTAIDLGARIFAVADTLDCMTSTRPFQAPVPFEAARDEIFRVAGTQLDPDVVAHFDAIPIREWNEIRLEVADRVLRSRTAG